MRRALKKMFHVVALVLVLPLALTCWIASALKVGGREVFVFWGQCLALVPGLPGSYLRRAFYCLTLEECASDCHIGFGVLFAHRSAKVGAEVYVGNYAMLGRANLERGCLIGSRASILSGQNQHVFHPDGHWLHSDVDNFEEVTIGAFAWIGEAAVVMANVGKGAAVSAGSVVANPLPEYVVVAGNPARFVRKLEVNENGDLEDESGVGLAQSDS